MNQRTFAVRTKRKHRIMNQRTVEAIRVVVTRNKNIKSQQTIAVVRTMWNQRTLNQRTVAAVRTVRNQIILNQLTLV